MKSTTVSCICLVALGVGHSIPAAAELLYAQSNLQLSGGKLSPVNYRTGPMIPVGTTVTVLERTNRGYKCVSGEGVEFMFVPYKGIRLPIEKAFSLFVAAQDPRPQIERLSKEERGLVRQGAVEVGMTKRAVLLSIGPPPSHKTPSLDAKTWLYWKGKFGTFKVMFDDADKVVATPGLEGEKQEAQAEPAVSKKEEKQRKKDEEKKQKEEEKQRQLDAAHQPPIIDPGDAPSGGNASIVIACDCGALEMYVDGQLYNSQSGSARWDGLSSGQHTLKIMAWTGPFNRKLWYDGIINLWPNTESRVHITKNGAQLIGKGKSPKPVKPPAEPSEATYSAIDEASEFLKDAIDVSEEEDCGRRMDEKLGQISERLQAIRSAPSANDLGELARKVGDLGEDAEDACGKRGGQRLVKKLDRVKSELGKAKETLR